MSECVGKGWWKVWEGGGEEMRGGGKVSLSDQ